LHWLRPRIHHALRWVQVFIEVALLDPRRVPWSTLYVFGLASTIPAGCVIRPAKFVEPIGGLNVVLVAIWSCAAWRISAQSIEKIVRGPVLLNHHDDVLKLRDLSLCGNYRQAGDEQQGPESVFHDCP